MDLLITAHRKLQPVVSALGLRKLAQKVFRFIYRRRFTGDQLVSARQNGRTWMLDPEVALRGDFQEFATIEWLRQVIRPGDTVLDVGANVGQMTLEMAHLVGPTGRVIAIEPAPGNLAVLRRHIQGNGFSERVAIVAAACAEQHGATVVFKIFGTTADAVGSGHTLLVNRRLNDSEKRLPTSTYQVTTVSIDALCSEMNLHPSAVKIDVEGAELMVLAGCRRVLRTNRPSVRFGFHPNAFEDAAAASDKIRAEFAACGYQVMADGAGPFGLNEYVATPLVLP